MLSLPILRRKPLPRINPVYRRGLERYGAFPLYHEISKDFQLLSNPKQATFPLPRRIAVWTI